MTLKDKMLSESDSVVAIYMDYVLKKSSSENGFLFFEGTDDFMYYHFRITSIYGKKEFIKYDCGSKEKVIRIHNIIKSKKAYKDTITMFFVDKDFDDNSSIDRDIYITPTYSIENLYFTDDAIKNILKGTMGISQQNQSATRNFNIAFDYLKNSRDTMIRNMIYGNALYSLQIKKSSAQKNSNPNLSKLETYNKIKNISKPEFKGKVPGYIILTKEEIAEECVRLKTDPIRLFRGKYILDIMTKCVAKWKEEHNKGTLYAGAKSLNFHVSRKTLISDFSIYAETPNCLREYINTRTSYEK